MHQSYPGCHVECTRVIHPVQEMPYQYVIMEPTGGHNVYVRYECNPFLSMYALATVENRHRKVDNIPTFHMQALLSCSTFGFYSKRPRTRAHENGDLPN